MTKKIFFLILIVIISAGCKKILTEKPYSFLTPENFPKTVEEVDVALYGAYGMNQEMGSFAYTGVAIICMLNDEVVGGDSWTQFQQANYIGGREFYMWKVFYKGINSVNTLIEILEKMDATQNKWIPSRIAEARALRAFFYFYLVRLYGDVPIRLNATTETVLVAPRDPVADVYSKVILPDLEAADNKLQTTNNLGGRFTNGAVKSLMAEVYLALAGWRRSPQGEMIAGDPKYWAMARDKAKEVLDMEASGIYQLEPMYAKYFTQLSTDVYNKETILDVQFNQSKGSTFPYLFGPRNSIGSANAEWGGGGGGAIYQIEWLRKQDPKDERSLWNIANYRYVNFWNREPLTDSTAFTAAKWQKIYPSRAYYQDHLTNWPLFRLADVKLMYAEAANEANGGPTAEAYKQINEVRYRARPQANKTDGTVSPDLAGLTKEEFRNAIIDERSTELNMEGKRRFDLIRWGILKEKVEANTSQTVARTGMNMRFYLFAVPTDDLTINSWTQNAGY